MQCFRAKNLVCSNPSDLCTSSKARSTSPGSSKRRIIIGFNSGYWEEKKHELKWLKIIRFFLNKIETKHMPLQILCSSSDSKSCIKISNESMSGRDKEKAAANTFSSSCASSVNIEIYHRHLSLITCCDCKQPIINVSKPKIVTEHTRHGLFFVHSCRSQHLLPYWNRTNGSAESTSPKRLHSQSSART